MTDNVISLKSTPPPPRIPRPIAITNPSLALFMETLPKLDPQTLVRAPGMPWMKAKWIRVGLERGVLVVHHSGQGLAYAPLPSDHRAKGCACRTCSWEVASSEAHGGQRPVTRELRAQITNLRYLAPAPLALDDAW